MFARTIIAALRSGDKRAIVKGSQPIVCGSILPQRIMHRRTKSSAVPITCMRTTIEILAEVRPKKEETNKLNRPRGVHACSSTLARIAKIREEYIKNRYVFVKGKDMVTILGGLGARDEDFGAIRTVSDNLPSDPTLPFRESRNGRFCIDPSRRVISRLEYQPFALSVKEDFKRHDSDQIRHFAEIGNDLQLNSVFQALLLFKSLVLHGVATRPRAHQDYADRRWICTVFNLRTVTTPAILGEPALEGVHTDGVDHTMTSFLGSNNMRAGSCATALHELAEETGLRHDQTRPEHQVGVVQHRDPLDTLVIADNERKHSLSPLLPVNPESRATRDMLIFFTRKPAAQGHVSEHLDSRVRHRESPMEISLLFPDPGISES